jgi:hypothetical protein
MGQFKQHLLRDTVQREMGPASWGTQQTQARIGASKCKMSCDFPVYRLRRKDAPVMCRACAESKHNTDESIRLASEPSQTAGDTNPEQTAVSCFFRICQMMPSAVPEGSNSRHKSSGDFNPDEQLPNLTHFARHAFSMHIFRMYNYMQQDRGKITTGSLGVA